MSAIAVPSLEAVTKRAIRTHYDLATPFYRLLWGAHIHHGLWDADELPGKAQLQLVERLSTHADIRPGSRVLDVGCGMGETAIHLHQQLGCEVTGLTISPVQRTWATASAWVRRVSGPVRFLCQDVEEADFPAGSFDVIWSVECTEHLFDKAGFFERAAGWLAPGGRVAICAWLAGDEPHDPDTARQVHEVCRSFLCPSLGTRHDYLGWMRDAGLQPFHFADLTRQVARTWEICLRRIRRTGVSLLGRCAGKSMREFLDNFGTILHAYRSGAMKYGCFVAEAPV